MLFFFPKLLGISLYSICNNFFLRRICILFAMQEKNTVHSILLTALVRVQSHLPIIFLDWTRFYLIFSSPKRAATTLLYYFLYFLPTLLVKMIVFWGTMKKRESSDWDSPESFICLKGLGFDFFLSVTNTSHSNLDLLFPNFLCCPKIQRTAKQDFAHLKKYLSL